MFLKCYKIEFATKIRIGLCAYPKICNTLCIFLHLHREPCTKAESVFEDSGFGKAYVLVQAVVELFEDLYLLVSEGFLQVLVVTCYISKQFFHFT